MAGPTFWPTAARISVCALCTSPSLTLALLFVVCEMRKLLNVHSLRWLPTECCFLASYVTPPHLHIDLIQLRPCFINHITCFLILSACPVSGPRSFYSLCLSPLSVRSLALPPYYYILYKQMKYLLEPSPSFSVRTRIFYAKINLNDNFKCSV